MWLLNSLKLEKKQEKCLHLLSNETVKKVFQRMSLANSLSNLQVRGSPSPGSIAELQSRGLRGFAQRPGLGTRATKLGFLFRSYALQPSFIVSTKKKKGRKKKRGTEIKKKGGKKGGKVEGEKKNARQLCNYIEAQGEKGESVSSDRRRKVRAFYASAKSGSDQAE